MSKTIFQGGANPPALPLVTSLHELKISSFQGHCFSALWTITEWEIAGSWAFLTTNCWEGQFVVQA